MAGQHDPVAETTVVPFVEYWTDTDDLYVSNGRAFGDGETIAENVVIYYDREDQNRVVGFSIEAGASAILKALIDAERAKRDAAEREALLNALRNWEPAVPLSNWSDGCLYIVKAFQDMAGVEAAHKRGDPDRVVGFHVEPGATTPSLLQPLIDAQQAEEALVVRFPKHKCKQMRPC